MDDDDDRFLYGDSLEDDVQPTPSATAVADIPTSVPQPIPLEQVEAHVISNGVVANLEAKVAASAALPAMDFEGEDAPGFSPVPEPNGNRTSMESEGADVQALDGDEEEGGGEDDEGEGGDEEEEEEEDSDDDIEIILEPQSRSLDFRQRPGGGTSSTRPTQPTPRAPQPQLTTEYTPRERGSVPTKAPATPSALPALAATPGTTLGTSPTSPTSRQGSSDNVDTSSLPPATAPPSHPHIDPTIPGMMDGRSIFEYDMAALAEKPWRRPGSDLSDWFNYGFDEVSWEAYCWRRREVGEVAGVLKANVMNFAGMPEDQLAGLPPEIRTMVMAGASAMMNQGGGANPGGMLPPNAAANLANMNNMGGQMMNPMMSMGNMGNMGNMGMMGGMMDMPVGAMEMGMGMGMGGEGGLSGGVPMGPGPGMQGQPVQGQEGMGMVGDGQGMMGMGMGGMGGEFGMQEMQQGMPQMDQSMGAQMNQMGQQAMFSGVPGVGVPGINVPVGVDSTGRGTPGPANANLGSGGGTSSGGGGGIGGGVSVGAGRGAAQGQFRGRGTPQQLPLRGGRGTGFAGRGRGQVLPVRPASPLPPNVPTGPRNKNKYKDIDGSAPAVDGLDYGQERGQGGERVESHRKERSTPTDHGEEREVREGGERERDRGRERDRDRSSRKRRSSPGLEDGRGSKRR